MKKNNFGKLIVSTIFGLFVYALCAAAENSNGYSEEEPPKRTYTFGEAVVAVTESDMCSIDKRDALNDILPDRGSDYYEGIIGIARSKMCSVDKLHAIQNLAAHELNEEAD